MPRGTLEGTRQTLALAIMFSRPFDSEDPDPLTPEFTRRSRRWLDQQVQRETDVVSPPSSESSHDHGEHPISLYLAPAARQCVMSLVISNKLYLCVSCVGPCRHTLSQPSRKASTVTAS